MGLVYKDLVTSQNNRFDNSSLFDSLVDVPTGMVGPVFTADGRQYNTADIYLDRLPTYIQLGDSIIGFGNKGGSCTITAVGDIATVAFASHGQQKGYRVVIGNTNEPEFNGVFTVLERTGTGTFTVQLAQAASVATATGVPVVVFQHIILDKSIPDIANALADSPAINLGNFAQGGSRTDDLQTQLDRALTVASPDIIFCHTGINDALADVALAETIANVSAFISAVKSLGIRLVLFTQTAVSTGHANWSAARIKVSRQYNDWLKEQGQNGVVEVFDFNALTLDTATQYGDQKSGYTADSIHPSALSARVAGEALSNQIFSSLISSDSRVLTAVLANTDLSGTSGTTAGTGGSGDVATGYVLNVTGAGAQTAVGSKGISENGLADSQRVVFTAAAANDTAALYADAHTLIEAGKTYFARCKYKVLSGEGFVKDDQFSIWLIYDGNQTEIAAKTSTVSASLDKAIDYVLETLPFTVPAGTITRFRPQLMIRAGGAGEIIFEIDEMQLFEV